MESTPTAPQATVPAGLSKVVALDAKLTRGEAMDLLMEDLLTEMKAAQAVAQREEQAAMHALSTGLALEDIRDLLPKGKIKIVTNEWDYATQRHNPYITVTMAMPQGNAKIDALVASHVNAVAKRQAISNQIHQMESSKTAFKNTVLRTMLASTPEGQAALDALASVRLAIKANLVGAKED